MNFRCLNDGFRLVKLPDSCSKIKGQNRTQAGIDNLEINIDKQKDINIISTFRYPCQ
jgi:hypothetical protein